MTTTPILCIAHEAHGSTVTDHALLLIGGAPEDIWETLSHTLHAAIEHEGPFPRLHPDPETFAFTNPADRELLATRLGDHGTAISIGRLVTEAGTRQKTTKRKK